MKTFQQFKEEIKKKTFEPLEKLGRNFANSKELQGGIEKVVQSFGKDANIGISKFFKKLEDFKIPKK